MDKKVADESTKRLYKIDIKKMMEKLSIEELNFVREIMHVLLKTKDESQQRRKSNDL